MADERGKALDFLGTQMGANGGNAIGPKLNATLFVPLGYGVAFSDGTNWYRLALSLDANGAAELDADGNPRLSLNPIQLP